MGLLAKMLSLKKAVAFIGCVYGFVASAGLLVCHLALLRRHVPFVHPSYSGGRVLLGICLPYALFVYLIFWKPGSNFRWEPLRKWDPKVIKIFVALLVLFTLNAVVWTLLLFWRARRNLVIGDWFGQEAWTAFFLPLTFYVGSFFLFGTEKFFPRTIRQVFDWSLIDTRLLRQNYRRLVSRIRRAMNRVAGKGAC